MFFIISEKKKIKFDYFNIQSIKLNTNHLYETLDYIFT